jgi:hypothetical protein
VHHLFVVLLCVAAVAADEPVSEVVQLKDAKTMGNPQEGCAQATGACTSTMHKHTAEHLSAKKTLAQCMEKTAVHQNELQKSQDQLDSEKQRLMGLMGQAKQFAEEATEQEAEDEGMSDMLQSNFDSDRMGDMGESNDAVGLSGIKDALQKAEAVLTYNEIQSDRLFKMADTLASSPKNLSKKGMRRVKKASQAAARSASAKFVAEVQVTKLKAALAAAEKIDNSKKELGDDSTLDSAKPIN